VGDHTYEKAFINALFLAFQNFANSQTVAMNIAMVDVPRVCNMPILYPYINKVRILWLHICISAWGSALLVQTTVGNAKASKRGTGNDTGSRAFFMWMYQFQVV
jgi:hypothetical protein